MEYLLAFLVGGAICAGVQVLMDQTKLQPGTVRLRNGRVQERPYHLPDLGTRCMKE